MPALFIHRTLGSVLVVAVIAAAGSRPVALRAETRPINVEQSTLTVFVYKSGLFSAFADNHIIKAPIASGSMSEDAPLSVELTVHAGDLRALDPNLAPDRRADVQARMVSADVLDVARFPDITFTSTAIQPAGTDRWSVTGRLTIHGQARSITFPVARVNGRYQGEVAIKQRDFGIEPIRIAGGAVKVKDEMKVQFDIAPHHGSVALWPSQQPLFVVRAAAPDGLGFAAFAAFALIGGASTASGRTVPARLRREWRAAPQ